MNINAYLDEIERVANAATEGPWRTSRWEDFSGKEVTYSISGDTTVADFIEDGSDAAFIADARTTFPTLVAALRVMVSLAEWHETKAFKALAFPGDGRDAEMRKAAEIHVDAARRIRDILDTHLNPDTEEN